MNDKYKWIQEDTIYDRISNIIYANIHHIRNGDEFGTQYKITKQCLFVISNASVYTLLSTTRHLIDGCKESLHTIHILVKPNASVHDMKGKE